MRYIIDIDGTICTQESLYALAIPIQENIDKINKLWLEGNYIIYWTSRGGTSTKDWSELTEMQLDNWGCLHHELWMGKPSYDVFIDDKSKRIEEL